jgi:hypothetical protein
LDPAKAATLPGPELWRYEPDDRYTGVMKMAGEAEVDVREVDEDGDGGAIAADRADEAAVAGIDVGDMTEDLSHTHDGDVFGADDLLLMLAGHLGAAEAGEGGVRKAGAEGGDDLGAVGVAGGFAGGEEDARIGDSGDASSLSSFIAKDDVVVSLT